MKPYLKILRNHRRPFRFLLARFLTTSGLCSLTSIQQRGYRLRFHPSNLSEQLWIDPGARDEALEFFRVYLKRGDKVIDVGANIGDTVLTASLCVGSEGQVWAVEPHPVTFRYLTMNLELNQVKNVEAINYAVGESSGEVSFTDDRRDDMNRVGNGKLTVPLRRLDELVTGDETIALLKVDVEGYELPVFAGAKVVLSKTDCLYFEIARTHFSWFGYSIGDLLKLISAAGFKLFRIPRNGELQAINVSYESDEVENLVGIKQPTEFCTRTGWVVRS